MQTDPEIEDDIASDRLVGIEAIARFRGEEPRRTRHLIQRNLLPHGYEGALIVASKRVLREQWRRLTSGKTEAA
jgi:hypothetical protein